MNPRMKQRWLAALRSGRVMPPFPIPERGVDRTMKVRWANWDKPHRCPDCHACDWRESEGRPWRWWSLGRCDQCGARWSWGQARLRLRIWKMIGR